MAGFARATAPASPSPAAALLTGERLVVFLFAARVALAAPVHLAAALAVLVAAALAVELAVDGSGSAPLRRFRTRPGASSGILLGATTLPSVMLSRLIQLSRLLPADPNGPKEFAYLEMQYWAASISCLSVLALFLWHLQKSPSNGISKHLEYGSLFIVLYLMTFFLSFLLKTDEGEALLVSGGLVLYFGDMLAHTLSKMEFSMSSKAFIHTPQTRSDMTAIIQERKQQTQTPEEHKRIRIDSAIFYISLAVVLIFLLPSWTHLVQGLKVHPFVWIVNYMFTDSHERLVLCAYWICVIYVSVRRFYSISKQSKTERILLRKYYHLVAVLIFSPAVIFQPAFLDLAFGAAFAVFLILEMLRFMNAFTDHRDSEILIVSHFSLLLGCALPKWMSSGLNDRPLAPFAGILSLGIGDTMNWLSLLIAVTLSGLLEAYTAQLDNAFIPLVFYSLLCL
ncbi:Dolichol kinase EVAN [Zea mays]|uniref:dolichol kinase n=1 Tax=Zea mays TaxID=4577 RepID=A0A3L6ESH2_MAIZE|nr:Dolichol kinase EVAN [Zea mays]